MRNLDQTSRQKRSLGPGLLAALTSAGLTLLASTGIVDAAGAYAEASQQQSPQYVYVMDAGNGRVQKFDLNGTYITQFGSDMGINLGWGLAVDNSGNTWVAAQGSNALMEFDSSGNFVRWFGSPGTDNGQFTNPNAIALTTGGDMWVSDEGNHRAQRFNSGGAWQASVGSSSASANTHISDAWSITSDGGGNLYVVDYDGNQVQKFDKNGTYVATIGAGLLRSPFDAAVDASGNLLVVAEDRVAKFDPSGNLVKEFGSTGSANGQFDAPFGIAIDAGGNIWVADNNNNRVQKFDPNGNFLLAIGGGASDLFKNPARVTIGNR